MTDDTPPTSPGRRRPETLARVRLSPPESPNRLRELDLRSFAVLEGWLGRGEVAGSPNNRSPAIDEWRRLDGTGGPVEVAGAWCAVVQSAADQVAADQLGLELPYATHRGAKRYTSSVAGAGRWIYEPRGPWGILGPRELGLPARGDRICWHRGDLSRSDTRWHGHVARVVVFDASTQDLLAYEGNHDNRGDGAGRSYAVLGYRWIRAGLWRKRLYGVARLG